MSKRLPDNVSVDPVRKMVDIQWADGSSSAFHFVWLRHNARCPGGMPNDTSIKIDLLPDDPESLVINDFEIDRNDLLIHWNDIDIKTKHELSILHQLAYEKEIRRQRKHIPTLWNASSSSQIPEFAYPALEQPTDVLHLLQAVRDYGLARITNVPAVAGTIETVAQWFGPIHVNNYGRIFDVKTQSNVTLGSNTGTYLGPHTDEGYRHAPPGISLFHCLIADQIHGGESILVDGYKAADVLRKQDPKSFKVLTRIPIFYQRLSLPEENMQAHGRLIVTDIDGDVVGIRFTDRTIPPQDLPADEMVATYKAIKKFWNIVNSRSMQFTYLMQPGDLHVFDNHRVLHGRTAFETAGGDRHLQQCSINRDEFHNTLRTLSARLGSTDQNLTLAGGAMG